MTKNQSFSLPSFFNRMKTAGAAACALGLSVFRMAGRTAVFIGLFFALGRAAASPLSPPAGSPPSVAAGAVTLPAAPAAFSLNEGRLAVPLAKGATVFPVCHHHSPDRCLQQWLYSARPLEVSSGGAPSSFEYFMPSFLPDSSLSNSVDMSGWKRLSASDSRQVGRSRKGGVQYFQLRSDNLQDASADSGRLRRVQINESGKTTAVDEGDALLIPARDLEIINAPAHLEKSGAAAPAGAAGKDGAAADDSTIRKAPDRGAGSGGVARFPGEEKADGGSDDKDGAAGGARAADASGAAAGAASAGAAAASDSGGTLATRGPSAEEPPSGGFQARVIRDTVAAPALPSPPAPPAKPAEASAPPPASDSGDSASSDNDEADSPADKSSDTKTPEEGASSAGRSAETPPAGGASCVEIAPPAETEAQAICEECRQNNSYLSKVLDSVSAQKLRDLLKAVTFGDKEGKYKPTRKRKNFAEPGSVLKIQKATAGGEICEPEKSLERIVRNFNQTCKPRSSFDEFFNDMYCTACKAGIPPEVMPAMMSIESAGNCKAALKTGQEHSIGLFQINSQVWKCGGNDLGTQKNRKCLLKMENNLRFGIKVLKQKFNAVNSPPLSASSYKDGVCSLKPWSKQDAEAKDKWRRAVAAYNGGAGWLNRAVLSVEGKTDDSGNALGRDPSKNTREDLLSAQKLGKSGGRTKKTRVSWEELRLYMLMEHLLPGNIGTTKTGRRIDLSLSNLAHTEAVLGRPGAEAGGASHGMADYWENFIQKKQPFSCP